MTENNQENLARGRHDEGQEWQGFVEEAYLEPKGLGSVEDRLEKKIGIAKRKKRAIYSFFSTAVAALLLIFLVNANSAFAHTMSNIPVIGQLIEYIQFDKSLSQAIENEYIQEVALTAWDGEEQLSLPYVLADEKNMVLFFQLPKDFGLADNEWANISLKDMKDESNGNKVDGFSYSTASLSREGIAQNHGFIMQQYHFAEGKVPESISLDVLLEIEILPNEEKVVQVGEFEEDVHERNMKEMGTFTFEVKFEELAKPMVYEFHEDLSIYGQTITLEEMRVYPTGTEVFFTFADKNPAWIKGMNLAIEEDREIVLKGSHGISAMHKEDQSGMSVFIESDYFKKPKEQELLIRGLRLLDKEEESITVDMEKKTITPAIEGMELKEVIKGEGKANLVFATKVREDDGFGVFSFEYRDEEGNTYALKSEGTSSPRDSWMETRITVEYPENGRIILQRTLTPMLTLEEPIRIELPQR
ncbi:DUF4179 domain-containing protein [Desulfitobacterium sp. THU1]|uniref:DUF4179 domain-containing protein n=1 Tax=Desulfitobacterium sp. THU1 TaxID=3138072 RepID=UPI00311DFA7A